MRNVEVFFWIKRKRQLPDPKLPNPTTLNPIYRLLDPKPLNHEILNPQSEGTLNPINPKP